MNALPRLSAWATRAARDHRLPLLLLVAPVFWVVYRSDADNAGPLLVLPAAAFAVGALLRPRHVWLLWLGCVLLEWLAITVFGQWNDPGPGETAGSIALEAFGWMAIGVLLPAWLGRVFRTVGIDEWRHPDRSSGSRAR